MKANTTPITRLPHMGTFVKNKIDESNISYAEVSRRMNITPSTVFGYFIQQTLQTKTIWKLSHALGYNLFTDLIQLMPEELKGSNKTSFQQTITEQQKQIEDLQKEIATY